MRFTRLRLNGFKSFVDPTDLMIADGLTGVVGPNGCGKSNLLEALRWVMGENRASAMRGGGMEDVIFAGTNSRPARNFAEVALTVDNSERLAPSGFNDADTIEIVRRITRDAGSAYKVNTKDVRARDVQMLFADASTGAHSPALVRQGQISELINAKPKARRMILEEAAGISGLYARRHEAELKLKGTEANLLRVEDVIEQLAAQLVSLARQARQAARYREIGNDLRRAEGMLLYRRWREADQARAEAEALLRDRLQAAGQAERAAREAGVAREAAEAALPPLREEEAIAGAVLQRLVVERDTLAGQETQARQAMQALEGRIVQLTRDIEREEALNRDAGETMRGLREEAEALDAASEGHEARLAEAAEAARAAGEVMGAREDTLRDLNDEVGRLSARHQSAARLVEDSRKTVAQGEADAEKARAQRAEAEAALARAAEGFAEAEAEVAEAQALAAHAETVLAEADVARAEAQSREADARAARSEAEGELNALSAEVAALARLLDRDTAEDGQVLDLLSVAPGYEKAIGAALADDLRAPLLAEGRRSGWADLPDYEAAQALPAGVEPLAAQVKVPEALRRRIAQVGLVDADKGAALQAQLLPGQRLVSVEGDLWRWDGFRAAAEDAPSAAALRLQQLNRVEQLKQEREQAKARAEGFGQAHDELKRRLAALTEADAKAREARREADRKQGEAARRLSHLEADRNIAAGKVESLKLAVRRHEDETRAARQRLAEAEAALAALPDLDAKRAEVEEVKMTVEAARVTMLTRRAAHDELKRDGEARARRRGEVAKELASWQGRLDNAGRRIAELGERKAASEAELAEASDVPDAIAARRAELTDKLESAEARRKAAADALAAAETTLREATLAEREAEKLAGEARESRARAEARSEAARETVALAEARIAEDLDLDPAALLDTLDADPETMPGAEAIEAEVNRLKRSREALGAVNLRAEEDAKSVQDEHDSLVSEKADLESAVAKLRAGIASLNREGRERLLTAFEQVNNNFRRLFTHLFGGGEARLTLVESDDPLEAGLEILCMPPGKKLSTLSLLSGGEQTLTAMALIFAVFLANPAPICVLDEVDAPLDDANVTRFCDLLDEMTRQTETRFLVITHHAVTMSRMDRLFGVTMGEKGVSQLVSVDLKKAEALVA
ncbi:chromosome segregation protein SMC [Frigidibacter sp. ROC022]|uniref:chromosome segregation protein SMC n=1 Tax=Frigidibacter sp. ROC022 TaxID=2971796 RepID=UPI00215B4953|nr:chromosome segregation protein SMC [Frigidibacter sp. ROC022]MCR8724223.1 chromosome segregation protein SMC [Frigidibacter sp. ROC022]